MRVPKTVVLAIVLTGAVAAPTAAQAPASSLADLQGRLRANQTVYVQTAEIADEHGRGVKGKVLDLSGSTLQLLVKGQRRDFAERDILIVSERHTSIGKGALIGLVVGGGLGLWGITTGCGSSSDAESCGWAQLGLMFEAGFGTVLGAEIGHSIEHERFLFLAPDLKQSRTFSMTPFAGPGRTVLAATFRF